MLESGSLERDQVFCSGTLLAVDDIEFDPRALGQRLEALALDCGVMTEYVLLTVVTRNESETFFVVEPLD